MKVVPVEIATVAKIDCLIVSLLPHICAPNTAEYESDEFSERLDCI